MMSGDDLEKLCARLCAAVASNTEQAEPLRTELFAQGVLALNSLAHSFERAVRAMVEDEPAPEPAPEPEPAPGVGNNPTEPEFPRNSSLWRGRNGKAVDGDEFEA